MLLKEKMTESTRSTSLQPIGLLPSNWYDSGGGAGHWQSMGFKLHDSFLTSRLTLATKWHRLSYSSWVLGSLR
jgi:hypothetical protein